MNLTHPVSRRLDDWAVNSQRTARRNAMVAATELARRRAERIEVDEFIAARTSTAPARRGTTTNPMTHHG